MTTNTGAHPLIHPFDSAADSYDILFEDNLVTQRIRPVVWQSVLRHLGEGASVLDLNCGTGTDAMMMALRGMNVTAIDASQEMIEVARRKIASANLANPITTMNLSFDNLEQLGDNRFDGVLSNFGGLNCATNIRKVIDLLASRVQTGGIFVACVMNKYAVWEFASHIIRGQVQSAYRRLNPSGAVATVGTARMRIVYYTLRELRTILKPSFNIIRSYGLNIVSPPPNSRAFIAKAPGLTKSLLSLDDYIREWVPFRGWGDHLVIEARRL